MVKEKGGFSNVYISMHLPLLGVEGFGSKSSGRHTNTGAIQHDSVAHLAAIIKDHWDATARGRSASLVYSLV